MKRINPLGKCLLNIYYASLCIPPLLLVSSFLILAVALSTVLNTISYDMTYVASKKNDTNELIYKKKQAHRHRKQAYGYQRGKRVDREIN